VLSLLTVLFSKTERPRAIGIWGAANFVGLPLGPIVGGWLLTNFWWGWIFLMNVPVALLALVAVLILVPDSRSAERPGIDLLGVLFSSAGLVALMYGVVQAGSGGWAAQVPSCPPWSAWRSSPALCSGSAGSPPGRDCSPWWICGSSDHAASPGAQSAPLSRLRTLRCDVRATQYFQAILRVNPQAPASVCCRWWPA